MGHARWQRTVAEWLTNPTGSQLSTILRRTLPCMRIHMNILVKHKLFRPIDGWRTHANTTFALAIIEFCALIQVGFLLNYPTPTFVYELRIVVFVLAACASVPFTWLCDACQHQSYGPYDTVAARTNTKCLSIWQCMIW